MKILLFLWQLPQNLLGLFILGFHYLIRKKPTKNLHYSKWCYRVKYLAGSGISLGQFILFDTDRFIGENSVKHESGHQVQSRRLGPLYLIFIGLPSFLGNIWHRVFHKKWSQERRDKWYYGQLWERSADKLGGVKRVN